MKSNQEAVVHIKSTLELVQAINLVKVVVQILINLYPTSKNRKTNE